MQFNINDLVYQAQQKDISAFSKLYCMSFKNTYYFAMRFAGDEMVALELVTRIYKKAWNNIANLKQPENFEAWMSFITAGICAEYMNEANRFDFENVAVADASERIDENTEFLPQGVEDAEKVNLAINKIIDTLSDNQRAVVMFYYYDLMSTHSIAEFIGCTEEAVVNELESARYNIKAEMDRMINCQTVCRPIEQTAAIITIMQDAMEQTVVSTDLVKAVFSAVTYDETDADFEQVTDAPQESVETEEQHTPAAEEFDVPAQEAFEEAEEDEGEKPANKFSGQRIALICIMATLLLIAFIAATGLVISEFM